MSVKIVEKVVGGVEADLTFPPCPHCGTRGVFLHQTYDMVDGFFAIVDVYACPVCQPDLIAAQPALALDAPQAAIELDKSGAAHQ